MTRPPYFDKVRENARTIWRNLEETPELAGPWHQLFRQIQIPRHVVSELLQNADDAGASKAETSTDGQVFRFRHDGRDFDASDFASLCRFGYSNKRALHTIGFRGIGFKSTFSLGNPVHVQTPTLSFRFDKARFTEPVWEEPRSGADGTTGVYVQIQNDLVLQDLSRNLEEWVTSPASLLFLRSVRHLKINEVTIHWEVVGPGPIENSEWVEISTAPGRSYLHIRSAEEPFPREALAEIAEERIVGDEELDYPPCSVELLLGMPGDFYVILPTTVRTELPFAVNAPFIQDPGRSKLKEPELSHTNRWLLQRIGRLAADSLKAWLHREDLPEESRCEGYALIPREPDEDGTLESRCHRMIYTAFWEELEEEPFLLTDEKEFVEGKQATAVPTELLGVWNYATVKRIFVEADREVLNRHVAETELETLEMCGCIDRLDAESIPITLEEEQPPRPSTWTQLIDLWKLCSANLLDPKDYVRRTAARIVPAKDSAVLHRAEDLVRPSRQLSARLGAYWSFLSDRVLTLDPVWLEQLDRADESMRDCVAILNVLGLARATETSRIVRLAAKAIFSAEDPPCTEVVRIAQIAAQLEASVGDSMRYLSCDGQLRTGNEILVVDLSGDLDLFAPQEWMASHVLHPDYMKPSASCTQGAWSAWVTREGSDLLPFVPLSERTISLYGHAKFEEALRSRGFDGEVPENSYVRSEEYEIEDWDFPEELWTYWHDQAQSDPAYWARLVSHILEAPGWYWEPHARATAAFRAKMGSGRRKLEEIELSASWVIQLRELPCLPDTQGVLHRPSELLLRTAETDALHDIELFVRADLDTPLTQPLLIALGVRQRSTDMSGILNRLRALAAATEVRGTDLARIYEHIDRLTETLPTEQMEELRGAFASDRLILSEDGDFFTSIGIYLASTADDLLGIPLVHPMTRKLQLWRRIGVEERPTLDRVLRWLKDLPVGEQLPGNLGRGIHKIIEPIAEPVWTTCQRWVDLFGRWVQTSEFEFELSDPTYAIDLDLFPVIRMRTADLRFLSRESREAAAFAGLESLSEAIELRVEQGAETAISEPCDRPWTDALGELIGRIQLEEDTTCDKVQVSAERLRRTKWRTVTGGLAVLPYHDGAPAGTSHDAVAVWLGDCLYVADTTPAGRATAVIRELARPFRHRDIEDAIRICYERTPAFIHEYFETAFDLSPVDDTPVSAPAEPGPARGWQRSALSSASDGGSALNHAPISSDQKPSPVPTDESGTDVTPEELTTVRAARRGNRHDALIREFLERQGFTRDGESLHFLANDGRWAKKGEGGFWEQYESSGELERCYWPRAHCLEKQPLSLPAEVWELCKRYPRVYSFVLMGSDGEAVEYTWNDLSASLENGKLRVYVADYRLEFG